jgi:hypothetical protein
VALARPLWLRLDVALVGGLAIVFDFYKASDDKSVQLYLPKGVAIPRSQ